MSDARLSGGTIWRANRDVICKYASDKKARRVVVDHGELVEFRYPHNAHFRVRGDIYLYLDEKDFLNAFDYVGEVFEAIRMRNQNTLADIIDAKLYKETHE